MNGKYVGYVDGHDPLNLLRIARNDYLDRDYSRRLIRQAKRLLQAA